MLFVVLDDSVKSNRFRDRLLPKLLEKADSEVSILDPNQAKDRSLGDYLAWYPLIYKETPEREFFRAIPANWDDDYLIKPIGGDYNEEDILDWYRGKRYEPFKLDIDNLVAQANESAKFTVSLYKGFLELLKKTEEKCEAGIRDIKVVENVCESFVEGVCKMLGEEKSQERPHPSSP